MEQLNSPARRGNGSPSSADATGRSRRWTRVRKYAVLTAALIAVVIVPFVIWGDAFEQIPYRLMSLNAPNGLIAGAGIALLAADVVLPVPSSVVISLMGGLLGAFGAIVAGAVGLTLGCVIGYALGQRLGRDITRRQMGRDDYQHLGKLLDRYGVVMLAACRPVPVLAEASIIAAGIGGMPPVKALTVTSLANVGIASGYALLGAFADGTMEFVIVLFAALLVPGLAILAAKVLLHRSDPPPE